MSMTTRYYYQHCPALHFGNRCANGVPRF